MSQPAPKKEPPHYALNWTAGSVRVTLALGVLAALWLMALLRPRPANTVPFAFVYLSILMVLIMASIFAAFGNTIGRDVTGGSPLGMPNWFVRLLLLGGFGTLGYYLFKDPPGFDLPQHMDYFRFLMVLCTLVGGFILGDLSTRFIEWINGGDVPPWWKDIEAWVALIAMGLLLIVSLGHVILQFMSADIQAQVRGSGLDAALTAAVGFYFGSRA
jgi:hypothetical protein